MSSVVIYISIHFLNFLAIFKSQFRILISISFCILSIFALSFAPIGYDLEAYKFYLKSGTQTELGYFYLSNIIYRSTNNLDLSITILRIIGAVLAIFAFKKISKTMRFYDIYLPLFSICTILLVQNNLRQGYSVLFLILSIAYFVEKKQIKGILNFITSIMFHFSSLYIAFLSFLYIKLVRKIISQKLNCILSYHLELFLLSVCSIIVALTIAEVLPERYVNYQNLSVEAGRVDTTLKSLILLILFYMKDLYRLQMKYEDLECRTFLLLRIGFVILALIGSMLTPLDELFSRMTFIAYAFEFALLARLFCLRYKKMVLIEFLTPAAALNAINVLSN